MKKKRFYYFVSYSNIFEISKKIRYTTCVKNIEISKKIRYIICVKNIVDYI